MPNQKKKITRIEQHIVNSEPPKEPYDVWRKIRPPLHPKRRDYES
jgi:hypothetical protein